MRPWLVLLGAALLAACAGPGPTPPPTPAPTAPLAGPASSTAAGARDPAVLDIVGSAWLIRTASDVAPPASPFLDLWIKAAGLDPEDASLIYATTGDQGGLSLFCRAGPPPDAASLKAATAGLSATDPAAVAVRYALAHPAYLYDASMALLTTRPDRAARDACAKAGIVYRELTLGLIRCESGICPAVLLLKEDRLAESPTARRLLEALVAPHGLLADQASLAEAGMLPLKPADRARIQGAVAALLARDRPA
ncbi:hypothetical protein SAMN07250955_10190 [Arboricoccus pini]|uniref:Uncharacterized protein n=1 Tax=Arboricoccus pini TaxID=1963835 RepID=A0A212PX28_9PROT|nr:hypothetical protein [Arboricoccus pini]SNB51514.1 hypothetical protein SAMN07250955_10190 [Arboricoccus pini]